MEKIYRITGLDCPNCTMQLENALKKETGLTALSIDYLAEKLFVELTDPVQEEELLHKLQEITDRTEPGVVISLESPSVAHREEEQHHEHAPNHTHEHSHDHDAGKWKLIQIAVSAVLFLAGFVLGEENLIGIIFFLISYLLIGWEILYDAVRNLFRGAIFDENFLMSVASIGAICIGNYPEGVAVMLLFQIGEYFQSYAVRRSRKSIADLMDIRPDHANVKIDGQIKTVSPETVEIGSTIVIKAGEKVPVDCVITEGKSVIDTSALTGESLPREVEKGELLLSGSINTSGLLEAETVKSFSDSTVSKILEMVENASSRKANTENFITKFSRYYTPIVVSIALLLAVIPPLVLPGQIFGDWIYRALTFLVVSCPCALVISVPLSFFAGVGGASKEGILIKGSNYMELLSKVDTVVFDKTGTITKGVFAVSEIHPTEGTEEELLTLAALGEASSNHPISQSILREYHKRFSAQPDLSKVTEVMELSGKGMKAVIDGETVLLGNRLLLTEHDIPCPEITAIGTVVHVGKDGAYLGYLLISDEIKEDVPQAMLAFKEVGVRKTVMLTGDNEKTAKAVAEKIALDEVCADLLPNEKVEKLETILSQQDQEQKVAFVGDGINDAPVLARADIGIAMGGVGSDAAIEAADIVIMTDEISKLPVAIRHAKKTLSIVRQNILFALGVKLLILILGAFGIAVMWEAVFADVGVCLIAILNAMRALKVKK